jgi:hypothetical protein
VCRNECWRTKEPPDRDRKRTAQTKSWLSWSEGRVGAQCRARSKSQSAEHTRAERRVQSRAQSTKLNMEPRTEYRARKRWWPPSASRTSVENGWEATTVFGKNHEIVATARRAKTRFRKTVVEETSVVASNKKKTNRKRHCAPISGD